MAGGIPRARARGLLCARRATAFIRTPRRGFAGGLPAPCPIQAPRREPGGCREPLPQASGHRGCLGWQASSPLLAQGGFYAPETFPWPPHTSPPARAGGMPRATPAGIGPPGLFGMAGVIPLACARGLLCARDFSVALQYKPPGASRGDAASHVVWRRGVYPHRAGAFRAGPAAPATRRARSGPPRRRSASFCRLASGRRPPACWRPRGRRSARLERPPAGRSCG
jgi:hypothetical protein